MRRAALPAIGILGLTGIASAEPWAITMESGAEADSNVERVETVDGGTPQRIAAPAARAGVRIDHHDYLLGGTYILGLSGLARMVASSRTKPENVMLYAGESRWLTPLGSRPIAAGLHLVAADAFAITGGTGARTFRNLGADAVLVLGTTEDHHLMLGVGGRDFRYKPDHAFDWRGPVATARLDVMLWQTSGKTESLELAATLGFEERNYASKAVANCATLDLPDPCTIMTVLPRSDRYQRAGVEVSWIAHVVVSGGYQLIVIDSNSYGQSLLRQRLIGAVTMELPWNLFGTATGVLQIDQYPDGILIEKNLQRQEFTSLEDENRSSLQLLLTRKLSAAWSLEARGVVWHDFANAGGASFRRELIYAGVTYMR